MDLVCAKCRNPYVKAIRRKGMVDRLLSLAYAYPFQCQICLNRFHLLQWGLRYIEKEVDRRQYERRPVKIPVRINCQHGDNEGLVTDLAMGGCAIQTRALFNAGDVLKLSLDTFDYEPGLTIETAVVRSVSAVRTGVEFIWRTPDDQERERLSQYLLRLWTEGTQEARKGALAGP